jgi:hypothetical protein
MPVVTWVALAFFLLAVTASGVHAGRTGWRTLKALGASAERTGHELESVIAAADETARSAAGLSRSGERLSAALVSFSRSQAELAVLLGAVARVRRSADAVRAVVYAK